MTYTEAIQRVNDMTQSAVAEIERQKNEYAACVAAPDRNGQTRVTSPNTSRVGIIARNDGRFYLTLWVNHGETIIKGGRSFATLHGAVKSAATYVAGE